MLQKNELREENSNSVFNNNTVEGNIYSSHIIYFSEQLVSELQQHISTLKEEKEFIKTQYEHRLKEKDDFIALLKKT